MIPVCLVTGFLGSGKTTFLQHIVESRRDKKLIYLINEFAPVDIDGRLLSVPEGELITISGGSIFCRCLVADFIRTLRSIDEKFGAPAGGAEGVVIETSGIANPKVIQQMLQETKLDNAYQVRHIISVIDPGSFLKLIHTLPNIIEQVEASSRLILNKTDLYPEETVAQAETELRKIHPSARIDKTQYCKLDIDLFSGEELRNMQGEYALCADPNYAETVFRTDRPIDWLRLKSEITKMQSDVFRVKGFVRSPDGIHYIDYSQSGWREESIPHHPQVQSTEIVLIVRGQAQILAGTIHARFERGEFFT